MIRARLDTGEMPVLPNMENRTKHGDAVLSYSRSVEPPAERLPFWKVILLALFFVPPVVFFLLLLLAGKR